MFETPGLIGNREGIPPALCIEDREAEHDGLMPHERIDPVAEPRVDEPPKPGRRSHGLALSQRPVTGLAQEPGLRGAETRSRARFW